MSSTPRPWPADVRTNFCPFASACTAQQKVTGHMQKSTEVMKMMNKLAKVTEVSEIMQQMQKEMLKVCRAQLCHGATSLGVLIPHHNS